MDTQHTDQLTTMLASTIGREITARRLAGNSLIVYLDSLPGDATGLSLWFEPTWNLRSERAVLTGSRQAQSSDDPDESSMGPSGFNVAADAVDLLVGQRIASVLVDEVSGDLRVSTSGGFVLSTFISDPSDDHFWHLTDRTTGEQWWRGSGGVTFFTK